MNTPHNSVYFPSIPPLSWMAVCFGGTDFSVTLRQWAFAMAVRLSDQNRPLGLKLIVECGILLALAARLAKGTIGNGTTVQTRRAAGRTQGPRRCGASKPVKACTAKPKQRRNALGRADHARDRRERPLASASFQLMWHRRASDGQQTRYARLVLPLLCCRRSARRFAQRTRASG